MFTFSSTCALVWCPPSVAKGLSPTLHSFSDGTLTARRHPECPGLVSSPTGNFHYMPWLAHEDTSLGCWIIITK